MPEAADAKAGALLALWNDVDPALDAAYNDWHAREHVPERLTVPGIVWALRYASVADEPMPCYPRYLTLYGLRDAQVLDSAPYRRLLDHPTPASRAMRPALSKLARWVCSLDIEDGIGRFPHLALHTVAHTAPLPARPAGGALLVASRIPDAAPLPWLAGGQASPIPGDRLDGWAFEQLPGSPVATRHTRYTLLQGTPLAP
jgi:hypothetical protein